jgi:hypothetical protein
MLKGQRSSFSPEISSSLTGFDDAVETDLPLLSPGSGATTSSTIESQAPQDGQRPIGWMVVRPHSWQTNWV